MNPMLSTLLEGVTPGVLVAAFLLIILPWLKRDSPWRIVPIAVAIGSTIYYLHWRMTATIPPMERLLDFSIGSLFFLVEFTAAAGTILSYITLSRTRNRSADVDANTEWLFSHEKMPLVDVFICTYNEEREILERTIVGATGMNYPNFRVWVLDDGRREWLSELASELKCNYLTRPDNNHAKAGNINHALGHVNRLDNPPDFVSILDADFVPTPVFLSRAMTLFRDETVGIVQTPQHFINPDPIQANLQATDAWPDEQRYFFDILMPSKDAWGTAFCCGTSSVIRMDGLNAIGGFATESVTEDYLLTLRMQRKGYGTAYLNERLSLGLAPEGLSEYVTQRSRWCLGFCQIIRGADGPFKLRNGLRFIDRVSLVESLLYWAGAYSFRVAGLLVPILFLLFGIHAVNVDTADGIAHFLPYYIAQITVMGWISGLRILPVMADVSQLLAAREILTAVAVGLFRPKGHKFQVTAKGGDRSKTIVQWRMLMMFLTFIMATVLGIVVSFGPNGELLDSSAVALYWSWYNMLILVSAIFVCIERPRMRQNERLRGSGHAKITIGSSARFFETADVSVTGMRLHGSIAEPVGTDVTLHLGDLQFAGKIMRRSANDFAIQVENSLSARTAMVRHVYSGTFQSVLGHIRLSMVARRILERISR